MDFGSHRTTLGLGKSAHNPCLPRKGGGFCEKEPGVRKDIKPYGGQGSGGEKTDTHTHIYTYTYITHTSYTHTYTYTKYIDIYMGMHVIWTRTYAYI